MKERPIIFSAPMVRAILEGRKTMTRRVIKPQPDEDGLSLNTERQLWLDTSGDLYKCPYGVSGDRLWVRETFAIYQTVNYIRRPDGRAFPEVSDGLAGYRADGFDKIRDFREHIRLTEDLSMEAIEIKDNSWRPSIYMPRWASRITLEITDVGVERVQDITEEDAKDEGAPCIKGNYFDVVSKDFIDVTEPTCRFGFHVLWDSINAKRGFGWDKNPWVWVVEFKEVEK